MIYLNPDKPIKERVADLISRLTLEEKVSQLVYFSSAIPRLGIPEYNWWNECLHGVCRAGVATVFPQAIGMAASFNQNLLYQVASVISDEARAKHHEFVRHDDREIYKGLTFWTPNINIFRDPRWGRGQETYGEDPYLTARMGIAFVKGLQGEDPNYLKVVATPKHYAVHSGPETLRHSFDARVSAKDLMETYLLAFKCCVKEANAWSIMGAYNRVNAEPCCASITLLQKILREEWGFKGYVVSDCGALEDIHAGHKVTARPEESVTMAITNGCDLSCGQSLEALLNAAREKILSEEMINRSVTRLFTARFKLGMFDPPEKVPYAKIPYEINDCEKHRRLARKMARESIVMLKNDGVLPLNKKKIKTIAVIGPNADNKKILLGNYEGTPSKYVTPFEGVCNAFTGKTRIYYAEGCELIATEADWSGKTTRGFAEALSVAERSDAIIMCLGLSPDLEGEEGAGPEKSGDRKDLDLINIQEELLKAIYATGKPTILVLFNGSPISINWAQEHIPAIIEAWYPGEEGGTALADVIFGKYNPAGRLPITFVKSIEQLPEFTDYRMKGRTYRYLETEPLYPFGYGLSYTEFQYRNLKINSEVVSAGEPLHVTVQVKNAGKTAGDEVVQFYLKDMEASVTVPVWELRGFTRIHLKPKEKKRCAFTITARDMALINNEGKCVLEPGKFRIFVGGHQPDKRSAVLTGTEILACDFEVTGKPLPVAY